MSMRGGVVKLIVIEPFTTPYALLELMRSTIPNLPTGKIFGLVYVHYA